MATQDHTSAAYDDAPTRIPTNPLSRPYWTLAEATPERLDTATLAGMLSGIRALARVLTNSEAFRDIHSSSVSETIDPGWCPLDAPTTEGLFAALYFLSEEADALCQPPVPRPSDSGDIDIDSDDVPY
jgi:hypothetical protein